MDQTLDRWLGTIVGLACGDSLGAPLEFMSREEIMTRYGEVRDLLPGGWLDIQAGETTDDTAMTMATVDSLLDKSKVDCEDIARRFVAWYRSGPKDIGSLTRQALALIDKGTSWSVAGKAAWEASGRSSAGNGSIMRCAPIALVSRNLVEDSCQVSAITHYDPRCQWGCVLLNTWINREVSGVKTEWEELVSLYHDQLPPEYLTPPYLKPTGYVVDTLLTVARCLELTSSLEEAIVLAANQGGDADTVAAVCGAVAGARYGLAAIPERWKKALIDFADIKAKTKRLYEIFGPVS